MEEILNTESEWISADEAATILHLTPYQLRAAMRHHELNIGLFIPHPNKRGGRYKISRKLLLQKAEELGFSG